MKRYLLVSSIFLMALFAGKINAQVSGTINLGPDFVLPVCQQCTTLVAATTPASGAPQIIMLIKKPIHPIHLYQVQLSILLWMICGQV